MDALTKQRSRRHGTAVKRGIRQAKARKAVVKKATLALRKAPKQAIVQQLFAPPPAPRAGGTDNAGLKGALEEEAGVVER